MLPNTFTLKNAQQAIKNPSLLLDEGKRLLLSYNHGYRYGKGVDVMSEDWDNLIILDACRYDYFSQVNTLDGELQKEISKAKSSWGFIQHNYMNNEFHDTVAVSANPFYTQLSENLFHTIESTLDFVDFDKVNKEIIQMKNWSPKTVKKQAEKTHKKFPNKRLIVHFMQPHQPFIGERGDEIREQISQESVSQKAESYYVPWTSVDVSTIRAAYTENLEIVLEYVAELLDELDGKTVITSDHGELLGERVFGKRAWGHGYEKEVPQLREVPWFTIDSNKRREVVAEEPIGRERVDEEVVSKNLEALGYK